MQEINEENFTLIISKNANFSEELSEEFKEILNSDGINIVKLMDKNYCSVIENGIVLFEESSNENAIGKEIEYKGLDLNINASQKASIILNGVELSNNHSGMNVLVYNNSNNQIVECIYIDYLNGNAVMGR